MCGGASLHERMQKSGIVDEAEVAEAFEQLAEKTKLSQGLIDSLKQRFSVLPLRCLWSAIPAGKLYFKFAGRCCLMYTMISGRFGVDVIAFGNAGLERRLVLALVRR